MIILVRHGEATHHTEHLTGGWTDSELTAAGRAQIQVVAGKLARDLAGREPVWRVLASDLKRARVSAEIITAALTPSQPVEPCKFLREKNNGQAAGLTESAAKKLFCPPPTDTEIDHRNYPGGETRREFYERTVQGLSQKADWEQENLLVVAHKGTIQNIIFAWLGLSMDQVRAQRVSVDVLPASVSVLGINKWGEHALFLLNAQPLAPESGYGLAKFKMINVDENRTK
jgi:probable phosphoglycerate mutase